jgi:hypothetical protein
VVLVAAADYPLFDPNAWWSNRESRKLWLYEWTKTLFTTYELWKARPEAGRAEYQGLTPDPSGGSGFFPPAGPDSPLRGLKDSASAHKAAENALGSEGDDPESRDGPSDSLKPGSQPSGSADTAGDSAGTAEGGSKDTKDSSVAGMARSESGPAAATAGNSSEGAKAAAESKPSREAEAKKAPAHAPAKKPPATPAKPLPKREEKKAEKTKKKG